MDIAGSHLKLRIVCKIDSTVCISQKKKFSFAQQLAVAVSFV